MLMLDIRGRVTWCNAAYLEVKNLPREIIVGFRPSFLEVGRDNELQVQAIWNNISTQENWTTEFEELNERTGKVHYYQTVFSTISDPMEGGPGYFVLQNDITEQKTQYQHLWKMAHHDRLTGLANRGLFSTMVDHSIALANRSGQHLHILFIDLDGFKIVNDNHGHDAGDFVLVEVSRQMQSVLRESDFIARIGGDEFAVILVGTETDLQAENVANKIISAVNKPMVYQGSTILHVGASVGLSTYPVDGVTENDLKARADAAMYEAKKAGKNRVCLSRKIADKNPVETLFTLAA